MLAAKKVPHQEWSSELARVMEKTKITDVQDRLICNLSKGYRQRVGIAQALLGNPKVIILDEPTVGLDPLQIIEIRDLIKSLGENHTVIFSSHILSEVQTICDEILMIAKGKLVAFDTPDNLEKQLLSPNEIVITTDASEVDVRALLTYNSSVKELDFEDKKTPYLRAHIKTDLSDIYELSRSVFSAFAGSGLTLLEINLKKANLEDIFIELAENSAPAGSSEESAVPETPAQAEEKEDDEA